MGENRRAIVFCFPTRINPPLAGGRRKLSGGGTVRHLQVLRSRIAFVLAIKTKIARIIIVINTFPFCRFSRYFFAWPSKIIEKEKEAEDARGFFFPLFPFRFHFFPFRNFHSLSKFIKIHRLDVRRRPRNFFWKISSALPTRWFGHYVMCALPLSALSTTSPFLLPFFGWHFKLMMAAKV